MVKTDRKDARGLAQLIRMGWFRPVHAKSMGSQEVRALLVARKQLLGRLIDVELSIRGILRGFGLKVGVVTRKGFEGRTARFIVQLITVHDNRNRARQAQVAPQPIGRSDKGKCGGCTRNDVDDAKPAIKRGSYLGSSLASRFLISGLSYKTTFNSELRISSFPLYALICCCA